MQKDSDHECQTDEQIQVILISRAKPPEKTAAALTFSRHLLGKKNIELVILPPDFRDLVRLPHFYAVLNKLSHTRFSKWVEDFWLAVHAFLPVHRLLMLPPNRQRKTLVLTLAMGHGMLIAQKFAARHKLPLVVRFDDWWPDIARVHKQLKPILEGQFRALHQNASINIYVSNGMKNELGGSPSGPVIPPIPEGGRPALPERIPDGIFRICYLGNLYDYGPMLARLAMEAEEVKDLCFEFRGADEPNWPSSLKERMRSSGQLHGFLDGPVFKKWYESFDAYLVAMFFEENHRRRVRTCFATKMLDYSSLGRPIVLWAPEDSSVVQWARGTGGAVCVTDPNPGAVISTLQELACDPERRRFLGRIARQAYETEFSPDYLQIQFEKALNRALDVHKSDKRREKRP